MSMTRTFDERHRMRILWQLLLFMAISPWPLNAAAPLTAVAMAPDGKLVVLGSQHTIELRTWPALAAAGAIDTELMHVHDLQFSPDGKYLLAAGGSPAESGVVEVLEWPSRNRRQRIAVHDDLIYRVAWSLDSSKWGMASGDGMCSLIEASTGERIARYTGHSRAVLSLAFLADGKTIASVGVDQTLRLWDSANGQHLRTLDNHVGTVNAIAVRPTVAAGSQELKIDIAAPQLDSLPATVATISEDRTLRIWQPTIGRLMRFTRLPSTPRAMVWSTAGDRLYVGCNDGHLRTLDFESMAVLEDVVGLDGRIHDLVVDFENQLALLVGESGFQRLNIAPRLSSMEAGSGKRSDDSLPK